MKKLAVKIEGDIVEIFKSLRRSGIPAIRTPFTQNRYGGTRETDSNRWVMVMVRNNDWTMLRLLLGAAVEIVDTTPICECGATPALIHAGSINYGLRCQCNKQDMSSYYSPLWAIWYWNNRNA